MHASVTVHSACWEGHSKVRCLWSESVDKDGLHPVAVMGSNVLSALTVKQLCPAG